ncbi:glycosyltransferase family 1 protein [Parabacteroides sp. Marseille-P3160]|uniref:glycosyltransferase family 4 protein n=1 Tax=Parabacteroides sp. Marseille-P3160 TaxID=1917887 RepID=UPI0009BAC64E|nr:glycosyltransferase family 1 protein [Parabacteroides sp. Marseille-P3160]
MRIAFDAKRITHNSTGLGNYSRFVVNTLCTFFPGNDYLLYAPDRGKEELRNQVKQDDSISYIYPRSGGKLQSSIWRTWGIPSSLKKEKADLFHGLSNELPLNIKKSGVPSVVTIHDLIFLRYPSYYKSIDRVIYNYKFKQACLNANKIIAISEMTRRDILSFYPIPEDKIEVVYQSCHATFKQRQTEQDRQRVKEKYHLPSAYILYVGSMEQRKNLLLLAKALKNIREDIKVVAVGKRTPYAFLVESYIKENKMEGRLLLLHNVSFADLPALYQMASLFVYPSFFEGFGIPIVEALYSHIPVIGATGSCLEEAGGPDSLYTDPNNPEELQQLIEHILQNPSVAEQMCLKGDAYVRRFEDEVIASQIMNLYVNLK